MSVFFVSVLRTFAGMEGVVDFLFAESCSFMSSNIFCMLQYLCKASNICAAVVSVVVGGMSAGDESESDDEESAGIELVVAVAGVVVRED